MGKTKKVFADLVWSVMALGAMHGVLQIIVHPYLNKSMGAERFGDVLYVLAILGIIAPSLGLASNNTRLIQRKQMPVQNGDYLLAMLVQLTPGMVVFLLLIGRYLSSGLDWVLAALVLVFTMLRSYGGVEYRLNLNYKGYFLYYLAISAGYLLGAALYPLTRSWILCFLLGELFCFLLVAVKGSIYWPLTRSAHQKDVFKGTITLASSYLLYNTVLYLDRLLLQNLMDGEMVTVYYVASLLGKTAALLIGPLNGVLIGHLTKENETLSQKQFTKVAGALLACGCVLYAGILVVCPVFVRLLYPDIADAVLEIAWLTNLSQVLCFVASPMLTVMLTFCGAKWQLMIQSVYAVIFIGLSMAGVYANGLMGFIWAGVAANSLRLILVLLVSVTQIRKINRKPAA